MTTLNEHKKAGLVAGGFSGDINTAESKWLKSVCSPYAGSIPDMWRYALNQAGYSGNIVDMQNQMLIALGYTTGTLPDKWYKYWRDTPLQGLTP